MGDEQIHLRKQEILHNHPLFRNLDRQSLIDILPYLQEECWPKSTCNLSNHRTLKKFHIIISGRLKIFKINPSNGREFTLFLLTQNDIFDIFCLLDGIEHLVFYETLDDVCVLTTPIDKMREWVNTNPEIIKVLLPYLGKQMRILEEYAANITLIDISTRLARLILSNINRKSKQLELINDLSHGELANLIGSTRAVVNRHLQDFKQSGIIRTGRKKMEIQNLELLLRKAEKEHL